MASLTDNEKVALLLSTLGPEAVTPALSNMEPARAALIERAIAELKSSPPGIEVTERILDDFDKFMRFALQTLNEHSAVPETSDNSTSSGGSSAANERGADDPGLRIFEPSDDPLEDLKKLQPTQIAGALDGELPKTIALVLSRLDNGPAAEVMDLLQPEVQTSVFFLLKDLTPPPNEVIEKIVRSTVDKGLFVKPAEVEKPDSEQQLANFLRELPKATRMHLVEQLTEKDQEAAERLQELLYQFEDILMYDNRSVQKLLGQLETTVLLTALQEVDPAISSIVFENLSKRAAMSLKEEMEFMQKASQAEVDMARKEIAQIIRQLDTAGDLILK